MAILLIGCATPGPNTVSTIPWSERDSIDGMAPGFGAFENADVYGADDGMISPEMPL